MKRLAQRSYRLAQVLVCAMVLTALAAGTATAQRQLKMPVVTGPGTALWKAANEFAERVNARTGGELRIRVFAPGTLVGPTETFEALGKGIIDLSFTTGEYWAGKAAPFAFVTYLPGGFDSPLLYDFWLYERGGIELVRELYAKYNIHLLSLPYYPAEFLLTSKPIASLSDLKGKKLVFSGAMQQKMFTALGAATVAMPTGERVPSIERGVIDGGDFGVPNMALALGAQRVAKHLLRPSLHQPASALELSMNLGLWKSLPDNLKGVLETEAYAAAWSCYRSNVDMDIIALQKMREAGVQEHHLSDADVREARKIAIQTWREMAKGDETAQKLLDSQIAVMKEFGLFREE
jgi:TRAP-type mannitol/chloroaromatic compound transport system substrate-binding protein